mgnify:CR=1 FL=1
MREPVFRRGKGKPFYFDFCDRFIRKLIEWVEII